MRVAQDVTGVVLHLWRTRNSSTHSMFHRPLIDVPDPFPSFGSTPPPSASTALPMTGIRRPSCATPPGGLLFGHLAESTPLTGTGQASLGVCLQSGRIAGRARWTRSLRTSLGGQRLTVRQGQKVAKAARASPRREV